MQKIYSTDLIILWIADYFGVRFLFLGHKNGAATPVDYLSAFAADSPFFYVFFNKIMLYFLIGKTVDVH